MDPFSAEVIASEVQESGLLEGDDGLLLSFLRERGLSLVQSAIVLAKTRRISLADAKEIVAYSSAWSADFATSQPIQDEIENSFEQ